MSLKNRVKTINDAQAFEIWELLCGKETQSVACVVFYDHEDVELKTMFVNSSLLSSGLECADIFKDIEEVSNEIRMHEFKAYLKNVKKVNKTVISKFKKSSKK